MTVQVRNFAGLVLDPNPHSQVPEGSLEIAENVVIDDIGFVRGRPGYHKGLLAKVTIEAAATLPVQRSVALPDGDVMLFTDSEALLWDPDQVAQATGPGAANVDVSLPRTSFAQARKNLYAGSTLGVLVYNAPNIAFNHCGFVGQNAVAVVGASPLPTSGQTWLANGNSVAYRVTTEREHEDGFVVVSAPSPRLVVSNTTGSDAAVTLSVSLQFNTTLNAQLADYAILKLWRSFQTSAAVPSDEMYLVAVLRRETTVTNGINYTDRVSDSDLGEALYTNPSEQSLAFRNVAPPYGEILFEYQGSLFVANLIGEWRRSLKWFHSADCDESGNATSIGVRTYSGTITSSSAQITSLADTTGLQVGMAVFRSGTGFDVDDTHIVSIDSGTAVTVSKAATGSSTGDIDFYDVVVVQEDGQSAVHLPQKSPLDFWRAVNRLSGSALSDIEGYSRKIAYHIGSVNNPRGDGSGIQQEVGPAHAEMIFAVAATSGTAAPTIQATHGDEYEPPLPLVTETAEDMTRDVEPALVAFSKRNQPEHFVGAAQQFFVGDGSQPILGAVVASNVAYIFKTDGVFTVTGAGAASGFRVDPFDTSYRLMSARHVCEANGAAAAWTDRGIIVVHPGGTVQNISDGKVQSLLDDAVVGSTYDGNMVFDERRDELVFIASNSSEGFSLFLVYNVETQTWVSRSVPVDDIGCAGPVPADYDGPDRLGLWVAADDIQAWYLPQSVAEPWQKYCDYGSTPVTVTGFVTATQILFTYNFTPFKLVSVGDIVFQDPDVAIVTSVLVSTGSGATVDVVFVAGSTFTGSAELWHGIDAQIRMRALADADPSAYKRWERAVWTVEGPARLRAATLTLSSNNKGAAQSVLKAAPVYDLSGAQPSWGARLLVNGAHRKSTHVKPGFSVYEAGAAWAISAATMVGEPVSRKVLP